MHQGFDDMLEAASSISGGHGPQQYPHRNTERPGRREEHKGGGHQPKNSRLNIDESMLQLDAHQIHSTTHSRDELDDANINVELE